MLIHVGIENHLFTVFKLTFEQFFQSHTVSGIRSWESMKHFFISLIFPQACQTQCIFHRNSQTWTVAKFSESLNISQWIKLLHPLISPHFFPLKSNIACASEFYYLTSITHSAQVCLRKSLYGHSGTEWTWVGSFGSIHLQPYLSSWERPFPPKFYRCPSEDSVTNF